MRKKIEESEKTEMEILKENNQLLKGILLAFALKEEKRENQTKILKTGGLSQTEITNLIGLSKSAEIKRKYRAKKKNDK